MPKRKKINRRSKQLYPDLDPKYNLKTRTDLIDQDYLHKLGPKELAWLNKFNKEEVNASFDSQRPRRNLNKSKKDRKRCYDNNNARNRDILTRAKASNNIIDYESLVDNTTDIDHENTMVQKLDINRAREAIKWLADEVEKDESSIEEKLIDETSE